MKTNVRNLLGVCFVLNFIACGGGGQTVASLTLHVANPDGVADMMVHEAQQAQTTANEFTKVIYFDLDSADLNEIARAGLQRNLQWLKGDSTRTIAIQGHTDDTGTEEYNLALGLRRAMVAKMFFIREGIEEIRITTITYGEEQPDSDVPDDNRRSVFLPFSP